MGAQALDTVSPLSCILIVPAVVFPKRSPLLQMAPPHAALLCTGFALVFVTSKAGLL